MSGAPGPGALAAWVNPRTFAFMLAAFLVWRLDGRQAEDARERRELLQKVEAAIVATRAAVDAIPPALRELARREEAHADAVRLTWPRVRLSRAGAAE